jgi:hypothetical protein
LKVGSKIPVNVCVGNTTQRHRMPQETEWGVVESLDKRKESEVERKRESQERLKDEHSGQPSGQRKWRQPGGQN